MKKITQTALTTLSALFLAGAAVAGDVEVAYSYDDGVANVNIGPPTSFEIYPNTDLIWGNDFVTVPGGEVLTRLEVGIGRLSADPRDGEIHVYSLEGTGEFHPRELGTPVYSADVQFVANTLDTVNTFEIPPTLVGDRFFVACVIRSAVPGGESAARVDTNGTAIHSWLIYSPDCEPDAIQDSSGFVTRMDNTSFVPFPGAMVIRAFGVEAEICPGDVDGSGTVDLADLNAILAQFGSEVEPGSAGDFDGSGVIDLPDLNAVLSMFGESC